MPATIPANQLVAVNPAVLAAGGSAVDVIGLLLTTSERPPIGGVLSFPDAASVSSYFGGAAAETDFAQYYFKGFDSSNKKPGALLMAQYNTSAVAAYLRGGNVSSFTLAQLQALSGELSVTIDGYTRDATNVSLSGATSFSSAASIIQSALNAADPTVASITATIGAAFTGSVSTGTLTVSAVSSGSLSVGATVSGTGVTAATAILSQLTGTTGGVGTYSVSISQTALSAPMTTLSNTLRVVSVVSGTLGVGQTVNGTGVTAAVITALGTGVGGTGTYILGGAQQTALLGSMTTVGTAVTVTYDSTQGAFSVTSGLTGTVSSAGYGSGTLATALLMTLATGAVISQGAPAASPSTFMDAVLATQPNWVTFTTLFNPDGVTGLNTVKQAFATWKDTKNNAYAYVCWDTDVTPTTTLPATGSLGYLLDVNGDSGTALVWAPDATTGPRLAAFVMGAAASIDFTQTAGRISFAFKAQAGLVATVTDAIIATNLAGSPQGNSRGNGYNFYGAYAQAGAAFTWFQRGFVTGDFLWLDSYINQIWLNSSLSIALLTLFQNSKSVPYSAAGNALIAAALNDAIQAGLKFGAYGPGVITAAQEASVNAAAGASIANTLQAQGWYLQVLPASPATRAARTTPPCNFWYIDQGSVQAIQLASIELQ